VQPMDDVEVTGPHMVAGLPDWAFWSRPMADELHVIPVDDLVDHACQDCPCGPTVDATHREDGTIGWGYKHHSLDGRELSE